MSYKMDYRSLKNMYKSIEDDVMAWNTALTDFKSALDGLVGSSSIVGKGADSVKLYLTTVHQQGLIPSIGQLIQLYISKFEVYYNDYVKNLDADEDSRFHASEFDEIKDNLTNLANASESIENEVISTLNSISDIFRCSRRDATYVLEEARNMKNNVSKLDADIVSLENQHSSGDFSEIISLIASINALINECKSKSRSYKEGFNANSFAQLSSSAFFIKSNVEVSNDLQQNEQKYIEASENAHKHVQAIEAKEKAERERIANAIKIGVAVVAATAVIVATAGGAAPVVIGLVSAGTAIASTATNEMLDEYVERGNLKQMDWGKMGVDCAVAGATGFISGYVGGGLAKTMKGVGPVSKLVGSSNPIARIAGSAAIGTTKDLVTGVINNTIKEGGEFVKTGEFHAETILGLEKGEKVSAGNVTKNVLKTAGSNVVESTIGEGFDSFKNAKSGSFNSGKTASRTIKNAAFGSAKEVASGIGTRATEAKFDGKDVMKETFDGQKITKDAIKGGIEEGYSGAKNPSEGKEIYKKTYYYTKDDNGNVVKVQNNDGSSKYRIDRNDTYADTQSPKGIEYDRQYIRDGGKIIADSKGNVIYQDSTKTQYDIDHPLKSTLKKAFVTGDSAKNTSFYDSNGNLDSSRSSTNYRSVTPGKIPDFLQKSEEASDTSFDSSGRFTTYSDTLWSAAV